LIIYCFDLYNNKQESIENNKDIDEQGLNEYCKLVTQVVKSNIVEAPATNGHANGVKENGVNGVKKENVKDGEKVEKNGKAEKNGKSKGHNTSKDTSQNIGFFNNFINFFSKFCNFLSKLKDKDSLLKSEKLSSKLNKVTTMLEKVLENYNMKNLFSKITQFKEKLSI
jgi:hypothetical protein